MTKDTNTPSTVLFVDDEEKARKYFAMAMTNDFSVMTAGSAAEALEILSKHASQIALIVSDQRMPEKSGVELLKMVKDYYPHIVRLLTTAYTDLKDAIEAINRGEILRYIQKPWDVNTLKTELRQAMSYFQIRNERDSLLEEKLSVRHRMLQIDRVTHLLLLAQALPWLRFSEQAVRRYIDQLVSNKIATGDDDQDHSRPSLDIWDQTLAETTRMQKFIRNVSAEIKEQLPPKTEFNSRLDMTALQELLLQSISQNASSMQARISAAGISPDFGISSDTPLLKLLFDKLLAFIGRMSEKGDTLGISIAQEAGSTQLLFEFPRADFSHFHKILTDPANMEIPQAYAEILISFLISSHHGGSLVMDSSPQHGSILLVLPSDPLQATLAEGPENWHENILRSFEPELY